MCRHCELIDIQIEIYQQLVVAAPIVEEKLTERLVKDIVALRTERAKFRHWSRAPEPDPIKPQLARRFC